MWLYPQNVVVVVLDQAARAGAGQGGVCARVDVQKPLNELEMYTARGKSESANNASCLNFVASPAPQAVCGAFYGGFSWQTRV